MGAQRMGSEQGGWDLRLFIQGAQPALPALLCLLYWV